MWVHYVFACAVGILGPLLASLDLGVTCVVRALKFVNGPFCKSHEGAWTRADVPTFLPRVAAARLGCRSRMPSRLSQHDQEPGPCCIRRIRLSFCRALPGVRMSPSKTQYFSGVRFGCDRCRKIIVMPQA